jgi:mannosyltransferase OCH1-like enzyme
MIPKLIHQTAKTADLDARSRRLQKIVRDLHPDWTYRLWTDADNDAFVRTEYPDFHAAFTALPKNIMRADVIRYLLMDRLGGMYLDVDYEMLRPFDLLHYSAVIPWESDDVPGKFKQQLGNAFFAAMPGHPFFRRVIDVLQSRGPLPPDADVLSATGPVFLTELYRAMTPQQQAEVYTADRKLFNPYSPRNKREYEAIVNDKSVYGMHHCFGTWREYTLSQRVRLRLSKLYRKMT